MLILITGASGFVGWNAVRHFLADGHDVVATYHTFPHYLHQVAGCQPVRLDLADRTGLDDLVARFQPHYILHAAALSRPQQITSSKTLFEVNVRGTEHLARAAARYAIPIVYISTDLVYAADAGRCDEGTPVAPSGAGEYARSKLLGEEAIRGEAGEWIVIRPSLIFGNGTSNSNSFTQFMERSWDAGTQAPLFVDQFRSFLYVGDLISAIEQIAMREPCWNQMFVCGGAERLSRAEFGVRYARAMGRDRSLCRLISVDELEGYVGGPSDISLDTAKLRATGWSARPLETSFAKMIQERTGNRS